MRVKWSPTTTITRSSDPRNKILWVDTHPWLDCHGSPTPLLNPTESTTAERYNIHNSVWSHDKVNGQPPDADCGQNQGRPTNPVGHTGQDKSGGWRTCEWKNGTAEGAPNNTQNKTKATRCDTWWTWTGEVVAGLSGTQRIKSRIRYKLLNFSVCEIFQRFIPGFGSWWGGRGVVCDMYPHRMSMGWQISQIFY